GDVDDIAQAVFEFKRPATQGRIGSPVQWTPLKNIRGLDYSKDPVAEEIRVAYLDHSDPELDDYHLTQLDEWPWCYSCRNLKDDPNDETRHRPVMHQGDAYRLTLPGLGELNKPADFSQVRFIFVAPHENYSTAWQDRLISGGDWHIVKLWELPERLDKAARHNVNVAGFKILTEQFLGA